MDQQQPSINTKSTLMSPPDATLYDSFVRPPKMANKHAKPLFPRERLPMSPPISPECKTGLADDLGTRTIHDPILFPSTDLQTPQAPLFTEHDTLAARKVVDDHVAARRPSMFQVASPPRKSDYVLALEFKSQVAHQYNRDRKLWYRREMAYLKEDRALQTGRRRYPKIAPATSRPPRVHIPKVAKTAATKVKAAPRVSKPAIKREGTPSTEAKRVAREDRDFNALVDYTPPLDSLPNKPNSMKVDWRGAPINLTDDPHIPLLHPDEVSLAANLRLDCATYLTSKRRIFIRRLECYKIGKEFRKTDAQQACKIDVNKASKLWQAFEKVGWLDPDWVRGYA